MVSLSVRIRRVHVTIFGAKLMYFTGAELYRSSGTHNLELAVVVFFFPFSGRKVEITSTFALGWSQELAPESNRLPQKTDFPLFDSLTGCF